MVETFPNGFHIWASYALVSAAIIGFAIGRVQVELTSLLILVSLLLLFEIFPLLDAAGEPVLETRDLLAGFANPALLSVMALLVLGNGLWRSGAMDRGLKWMMGYAGNHEKVVLVVCFTVIFLTSPFVSNTPVVVIFIPVFEAIARRYSIQPSVTMMPLSFIAILAGMTTLIGSSTNLLVSGAMSALGERPLGFFEFTLPGLVLATTGLFYVIFIMPRLLPLRISPMQRFISGKHRRFIAQFNLGADPKLVGAAPRFNILGINGTRLLLVQRGDHPFVPPFGNLILQEGDVLVIMATYQGLAEVHTRFPSLMFSTSGEEDMPEKGAERESWLSRDQSVAEAMIAPGSQFAGQNLEEIGFRTRYGCLVLGIERHARVSRHLTGSIIYEGDILVLQGSRDAIDRLREHRGVVVLDGSTQPLPEARDARMASIIFVCTILIASLGLLPISVTAIAGVSLMLVTRVLTLKQASRALDSKIFMMVGASLGLGTAMLETGAAAYLAEYVISFAGPAGPAVALSALFLVVALLTNVLSNNATAILFTPIALGLAQGLQAEPLPFVLAVLFGANCSFATPIAYQTNLLVMGPGYYRFADFLRAGGPLVILLWAVFSVFVPWYYDLS